MARRGSHLNWRKVADTADRFKGAEADLNNAWNRFSDEELARHYPESDFPTQYVEAKAGSMVLWLSQTVHQVGVLYLFLCNRACLDRATCR